MSYNLAPYQHSPNLAQYMRELSRHEVLDREQEYELAVRYFETGDVEAAKKLVLSHLRFVVKIAFGYRKYSVPIMELVQEGNLGLMEAVRKFDPYKGYRLITYAVWWIRAYIQKHILTMWSVVRRGTTRAQRKLFYQLRRISNDMAQEAGREIGSGELADALDVSEDEIVAMQQMMSGADISLDHPVHSDDDESATFIDFLQDSRDDQELTQIEAEEREHVQSALAAIRHKLTDRDIDILENRLLADSPQTLEDLSTRHGISRERVRQLESNIKNKIRKELVGGPADKSLD